MGILSTLGWDQFEENIWAQARKHCTPATATFELTPLCNFRCRMCYVRLDPDKLSEHGRLRSADEWLDVARQAMEMGLYRVSLTGGEILTHPEFEKIYIGLHEMGLIVSLLTNGSLVNDRLVELFKQYPPRNIRITLYGASNETYHRLCGAPRGFDQVMKSVRMLKQAGISVTFAFTETTENIDDLPRVIDIAKEFDTRIEIATELSPAVRGASSEAECLRVSRTSSVDISEIVEEQKRPSMSEIAARFHAPELLEGPFATCRLYRTFFFIDWNGLMETCSLMSYCQSRPFEIGFEAAWRDMHEKLSRLQVPHACTKCTYLPFCSACPGKRQAETGTPDGIPSRCCEDARERYTLSCGFSVTNRGGEQDEEELHDA